jgi:hypothetical protein
MAKALDQSDIDDANKLLDQISQYEDELKNIKDGLDSVSNKHTALFDKFNAELP